MQKYQDVVLSRTGNPIQGATIRVTDMQGVDVPIYAVNSDQSQNVNPVISNEDGRFEFYAADGRYNLVVSYGGNVVATITDILLEDPMDGSDAIFTDVTVDNLIITNHADGASKIDYSPIGWGATNVGAALDDIGPIRTDLADPSKGAALVAFDDGTAQDVLDSAKPMQGYTALRAYTGRATGVHITTPGVAGFFQRSADVVSIDDGGTVIVDALGRRWKREVYGFVMPSWFGTIGNDVADDRDALYKALLTACKTGARLLGDPGATYRILSSIVINRAGMPACIIDWNGASVHVDGGGGIQFTGDAAFLTTSLTADPVRNDALLKLASTAGMLQGDLIEIESPAISMGTVNTLHYYLVSEVQGNDVYIEGVVVADINPQQVIDSGTSGPIVVRVFHTNNKLTMQNGRFKASDPGGVGTSLLISGNYLSVVDNMEFDGHTRNQMYIQYNGHDITSRIRVRDMGYVNKDIGYSNLPAGPNTVGNPIANSPSTGDAGLSYGYGIIHARNYSSYVRDVIAGNGWHATDASRGQMHITYENVRCARDGYGCSAHEGSWHVTWKKCELLGAQGVLAGRVIFPVVEDSKFMGNLVQGITYSNACVTARFSRNIFLSNPAGAANASAIYLDTAMATPGPGARSVGQSRSFTLEGGKIIGNLRIYAGFDGSATEGDFLLSDVAVKGAAFYRVVPLLDSLVEDVKFDGVAGQFAMSFETTNAAQHIVVRGCSQLGAYSTPSNAALVYAATTAAARIDLIGNICAKGSLVRVLSANGKIENIIGNTSAERCVLGNATTTVKHKINNCQGVVDFQTAVTQDVNTVLLVA